MKKYIYCIVILLICIFPKITMAENEFFCENGQELINGGCYKYLGEALKNSDNSKFYCNSGQLIGTSCYKYISQAKNNSDNNDNNNWIDYESRLDYGNLCGDSNIKGAITVIGYLISLLKWIVPLIIIILGMIDFGKASISNDEKAINKATTALVRRFISGVIIFFVPTIIEVFVKNVLESDIENDFIECSYCLLNPEECVEPDQEQQD